VTAIKPARLTDLRQQSDLSRYADLREHNDLRDWHGDVLLGSDLYCDRADL